MLSLIMGLSWLVVYVLVIRRGFIEKTYCVPLVAICGNVIWEFLFAFFIYPPNGDGWVLVYRIINAVWLIFDLIIVFQLLYYGPRESWPSKRIFYSSVLLALGCALSAIWVVTWFSHDWEGQFTSFADNLIMSVLFVRMLYTRGVRGQSLYIALLKLIGTLASSISSLVADPASVWQWSVSALILFFDVLYFVLLYRKLCAIRLNPWFRV